MRTNIRAYQHTGCSPQSRRAIIAGRDAPPVNAADAGRGTLARHGRLDFNQVGHYGRMQCMNISLLDRTVELLRVRPAAANQKRHTAGLGLATTDL